VLAAARQATGIRGAGFIESANQRVLLHTQGQSLTPEQLATTVLRHQDGATLTLGDLAQVAEAPEPPTGAAAIMGKLGIILMLSAQYGANTVAVTQRVDQALEELHPTLEAQGVVLTPDLFRPATFIQTATDNVRSSLLIGAVLVMVVLSLFLFNVRTAAISCTAIPLSLLAGVTVLQYLGFSLNTMTLGGLAIAIGEVVDDAVIDVENILRRLRENRRLQHPRPAMGVVYDASLEVRSAVVYATFAVVLVFLPILTMSGVAGRLFAPLGLTYILAILASLLVALTVTPALCLVLLGRPHVKNLEQEPPVVRWLQARYQALLLRVERAPRMVIGAVVLFMGAGLAALPFFGGGFLPELQEGHFIIHMSAVPGTSLQESLRLGRQVTLELLKIPAVRATAQRAGTAEEADDILGTQDSEFEVDLKPLHGEEAEFAQAAIRNALAQFAGVNFAVNTFLTERIEETLSGYTAAVVINLVGHDLDVLDRNAQEVASLLERTAGATDIQVQSPLGTPQLAIRLRTAELTRWGFDPVDVMEGVRTAYQGQTVGQVYEGNRVVDVVVILDPHKRRSVVDVGTLPLRNSQGTYVRLSQLADLDETSGRYVVLHAGARRVQTVTCNVVGRDLNAFVADARTQIRSTAALPPGSYVEFGGAATAQAQSTRDLLVHSVLAGIGIVVWLSMVMGHTRHWLLVLINLPFALVGGVLAVFASGGGLSLGSLVGFVTLFGITLRNSIMLISHYEHLVAGEGVPWGLDAAIRGASDRPRPHPHDCPSDRAGPIAPGHGERRAGARD